MNGAIESPQPQTSLESLLSKLDEEVSRYYSLLGGITGVTNGIESVNSEAENTKEGCRPQRFNSGKLYSFEQILDRFSSLNNGLSTELKKLQQHV